MKIKSGHICVVTGGFAGMGLQLCLQLARIGCSVATCDIDKKKQKTTLELLQRESSNQAAKFLTYVCDVSDETACRTFKDAVATEFGCEHINCLFNNAGTCARLTTSTCNPSHFSLADVQESEEAGPLSTATIAPSIDVSISVGLESCTRAGRFVRCY
jgi:NAD(P)-dependent dehydrogenase (short-subunit alcohol dehydrogenase family)